MSEEEEVMQLVHGRVKWFDPSKGFGFIVSDQTDADILLHANVLRNFGQGSVADGAGIEVRVQRTQRGVQAVEVVRIDPPEGVVLPFGEDAAEMVSADILALELEPARVKWFDKGKGFGFANVFGRPEDVFVHAEVLRVSGFADLAAGEAVALRIIEGKRGRMAVQVVSWEAAARDKA
jgi:CspA family cold shock protein